MDEPFAKGRKRERTSPRRTTRLRRSLEGFSPRPPGAPRPRSGSTVTGRSPGFRVRHQMRRLPSPRTDQWHVAHRLTGYSCGGSAGLMEHCCPKHRTSLFIPSPGTCHDARFRRRLREGQGARKSPPSTGDGGPLMVGVARIELATPAMSTQCSTTELHAHVAHANISTRRGL